MIHKGKVQVISLVLVLLLVMSSSLALAANYDLRIVETNENKEFLKWVYDDELYTDVVFGAEGKYLIEYDGNFYKTEDVVEASLKNPGADLAIIKVSGTHLYTY